MKERDAHNQLWKQQKEVNRNLNLALRDGFVDGQMFRRNAMARRILAPYFREQGINDREMPTV